MYSSQQRRSRLRQMLEVHRNDCLRRAQNKRPKKKMPINSGKKTRSKWNSSTHIVENYVPCVTYNPADKAELKGGGKDFVRWETDPKIRRCNSYNETRGRHAMGTMSSEKMQSKSVPSLNTAQVKLESSRSSESFSCSS